MITDFIRKWEDGYKIVIGIIGEYIGAIYTQVLKRPLVVEKERINFD